MSLDAASRQFPAAPLDRATKLTSAALVAALTGLAISLQAAEAGGKGAVFGIALPAAAVALAYGFAPKGYEVSRPGELQVIRRWFGRRRFSITSAEPTSAVFGLGGIRLMGSGGAFGWYGLFWRKETGRYRAYVTDRSRLVSCKGPDGLIVVSPDDPGAFVAAVPAA